MFEKILNFVRSAEVGSIAVDGVGGKNTVKKLQKFLGLSQDGFIGNQNKSFISKYAPSLTAVTYGNGGSKTVAKLQKWCGMPKKEQDGIWGVKTSKALMQRLKDYGYASGSPHGCFNANWMRALQRALNNDFKKITPPQPTPSGNKQKLIDEAVRLAWPKGTESSEYKYPSGSATAAFKKALNKVYPEHKNWGKAPSVGASCDVFVGTVVRSAGLDSKFPRGLQEQETHKSKAFDRYVYSNVKPIDKSQNGDIVMFEYDGGAHTVIRGNGYYYEANYSTYFGHTNTSLSRLKEKYSKVIILRPKG